MSQPPRIVSIIPYKILPARLGGEKGIALFNEYLCREAELTGITTRNNDPSLAKGYRLLNILSNNKSRYANVFLYRTVSRWLRRLQTTHLLIEHPYYGWLAWMIRRTRPVQWLVHSHNIEFMRSKSIGRWWWKALRNYEGWVYRKADKVFFISEDDRQFAIREWGLDPARSQAITYGIEQSALPADLAECRYGVRSAHGIASDEKILLFNGSLYHSTNYDALRVILDQINPLLLKAKDFRYKILVCGKGLPESFNELRDHAGRNVIYAGFVDDVSKYFKAADIFLNPILSGGGVKTKAIEALAMNCTVISTELGALGLNLSVCGSKLQIFTAGEWESFAEAVIQSADSDDETPQAFFDYYYWGNIIRRAVAFLA